MLTNTEREAIRKQALHNGQLADFEVIYELVPDNNKTSAGAVVVSSMWFDLQDRHRQAAERLAEQWGITPKDVIYRITGFDIVGKW